MTETTEEPLVSAVDVAKRAGVRTSTLSKWHRQGRGPKGRRYLAFNWVVYPKSEVEKFFAERLAQEPRSTEGLVERFALGRRRAIEAGS